MREVLGEFVLTERHCESSWRGKTKKREDYFIRYSVGLSLPAIPFKKKKISKFLNHPIIRTVNAGRGAVHYQVLLLIWIVGTSGNSLIGFWFDYYYQSGSSKFGEFLVFRSGFSYRNSNDIRLALVND